MKIFETSQLEELGIVNIEELTPSAYTVTVMINDEENTITYDQHDMTVNIFMNGHHCHSEEVTPKNVEDVKEFFMELYEMKHFIEKKKVDDQKKIFNSIFK